MSSDLNRLEPHDKFWQEPHYYDDIIQFDELADLETAEDENEDEDYYDAYGDDV